MGISLSNEFIMYVSNIHLDIKRRASKIIVSEI